MAEMSKRFRDMGGEVYVEADTASRLAAEQHDKAGAVKTASHQPGEAGRDRAAVKRSNKALG